MGQLEQTDQMGAMGVMEKDKAIGQQVILEPAVLRENTAAKGKMEKMALTVLPEFSPTHDYAQGNIRRGIA